MDTGIAYLNTLLDASYLADLRRGACDLHRYRDDEAEVAPALEDQSSAASAQARDEYEEDLLFEARAIVAGVSQASPTAEHLRVLLGRLGSSAEAAFMNGEAPF
jgi:hypothetical protein